jgi:2-polyprenyl-3-methyl-5-hydroxy-6-metoxy-1,4-benzoquinol methylase
MSRTFDRTADVAKLEGCNTRNVQYRWTIFMRHLEFVPTGAEVLDYGCGSLRESFELSSRGFRVTSYDLDADTLNDYMDDYQWVCPKPHVVSGRPLSQLLGKQFSLVTAFDVFEHLDHPEITLAEIIALMNPAGLVFCTVPNRRSLFEIVFHIQLKVAAAMGHSFTPGVPHLQFRSPEEWNELFDQSGFEVREHEMAIGFFVNTWAAIVQLPTLAIRKLRMMLSRTPSFKSQPDCLGSLAGPRVMRLLNGLDRRTQFLRGCYGWNLFVLQPRCGKNSACG